MANGWKQKLAVNDWDHICRATNPFYRIDTLAMTEHATVGCTASVDERGQGGGEMAGAVRNASLANEK